MSVLAYLSEYRLCGDCAHPRARHRAERDEEWGDPLRCAEPGGCACGGWCDPDPEPGRPDAPRVVTLCGSMRFWPLMVAVAAAETLAGHVVLAPFVVVTPDEQDSAAKTALDELHRRKIAMSSLVLVVTDQSGYYGASTRSEIGYALSLNLPVRVRTVDRVTGEQLTSEWVSTPGRAGVPAWTPVPGGTGVRS